MQSLLRWICMPRGHQEVSTCQTCHARPFLLDMHAEGSGTVRLLDLSCSAFITGHACHRRSGSVRFACHLSFTCVDGQDSCVKLYLFRRYAGFKGTIQEIPSKTAGRSYAVHGTIAQVRTLHL